MKDSMACALAAAGYCSVALLLMTIAALWPLAVVMSCLIAALYGWLATSPRLQTTYALSARPAAAPVRRPAGSPATRSGVVVPFPAGRSRAGGGLTGAQ